MNWELVPQSLQQCHSQLCLAKKIFYSPCVSNLFVLSGAMMCQSLTRAFGRDGGGCFRSEDNCSGCDTYDCLAQNSINATPIYDSMGRCLSAVINGQCQRLDQVENAPLLLGETPSTLLLRVILELQIYNNDLSNCPGFVLNDRQAELEENGKFLEIVVPCLKKCSHCPRKVRLTPEYLDGSRLPVSCRSQVVLESHAERLKFLTGSS